jgi:hypothetical protein
MGRRTVEEQAIWEEKKISIESLKADGLSSEAIANEVRAPNFEPS